MLIYFQITDQTFFVLFLVKIIMPFNLYLTVFIFVPIIKDGIK
jgi:hypothetical protein